MNLSKGFGSSKWITNNNIHRHYCNKLDSNQIQALVLTNKYQRWKSLVGKHSIENDRKSLRNRVFIPSSFFSSSSSSMFYLKSFQSDIWNGKTERKEKQNICWNCGSEWEEKTATTTTTMTDKNNSKTKWKECPSCQKIQPLSKDLNFFQLFGLEDKLELNLSSLSKEFKSLQRKFHPDQFQRKSTEEQTIAKNASSRLNEGYSILKEPHLRAQYLVSLSPKLIY
eukprot:TRINITY_DN6284_c0_g1_i2.p1 TRINITY_DN6284_c0_g1~~TRINITY_DN6284_c0_g1_i2.p1  ORF type:complete len:225 (-),score=72.43 TRINITY_DN6284_c0_g1_i2:387-1061(-)